MKKGVAQVVPGANTPYCRALCAPTGVQVAMGRRRRRFKQGPQEVHATMPAFRLASAVQLPASVALRQIEPRRTPNGLLSLRTSVFLLNYRRPSYAASRCILRNQLQQRPLFCLRVRIATPRPVAGEPVALT